MLFVLCSSRVSEYSGIPVPKQEKQTDIATQKNKNLFLKQAGDTFSYKRIITCTVIIHQAEKGTIKMVKNDQSPRKLHMKAPMGKGEACIN